MSEVTRGGWDLSSPPGDVLSFGPFQFSAATQQLLIGDQTVRLGSRAAAILAALIERRGEIVTKEDLLAIAWPSTHVEEGNLRVHISALRRALGDASDAPKFIVNVSGRGYRFVAPVRRMAPEPRHFAEAATLPGRDSLPDRIASFIGRDEDLPVLAELVERSRLVTIAGTGGTGKTTIAVVLAHELKDQFMGAAYFVDLAAVSDAAVVPFAIASATRVAIDTQRPVESLVNGLHADTALILLDNCEHLIDTLALVTESLLKAAPNIRIVATSHEPLRIEGERVYRLKPFDLPAGAGDLPLAEALEFPAVRLFVQQMLANDDAFAPGDADVPFIVDICRRLDGLPLAIEIAAARAGALGIAELAERLDDRFGILTTGRRTAAPRHQTLRNMLDWSHDNLSEREKVILRRLAVFGGPFRLDAAAMVAADEWHQPAQVVESIGGLVRKSLLMADSSGGTSSFRLLDSTRLYAAERLAEAGEEPRVRQLHLHHLCDVLRQAEADWQVTPARDWGKSYSRYINDIRAALIWAFGPEGSDEGGVLLTSLALPLAMQLGLHDEFRERLNIAKARAAVLNPPLLVPELRLHCATNSLGYNVGQKVDVLLSRAVELSERIGSDRHRMEPLVQISSTHISTAQYEAALAYGQRAFDLAERSGDGLAVLSAGRALAQAAHYAGQHARAIELSHTVMRHPAVNIPYTYGFMHTDRRVTMRWVLVRALWMSGRGDEAARVAEDGIPIAEDTGVVAIAQFLGMAVIPMYLWRGDDIRARDLSNRLRDHADRYSFKYWKSWSLLFGEVLDWRESGREPSAGLDALQVQTLSTLVGTATPLPETVGAVDWAAPEVMRLQGVRALEAGQTAAGEARLLAALDLARAHGALGWELRCAMSLARLRAAGGGRAEAAENLAGLLDRLPRSETEADQLAARRLLAELG